jgi:hypothetical protein
MTSAAWVPIDPVEPSRTTLRGPPREESTPPFCPVHRHRARVGSPAPDGQSRPFRAPRRGRTAGPAPRQRADALAPAARRAHRHARRLASGRRDATRLPVLPTAPSPGAAASPSGPPPRA